MAHASWVARFGRVRVLVCVFRQRCPLRSRTALVCALVRRVFLVVFVPFLVIEGVQMTRKGQPQYPYGIPRNWLIKPRPEPWPEDKRERVAKGIREYSAELYQEGKEREAQWVLDLSERVRQGDVVITPLSEAELKKYAHEFK